MAAVNTCVILVNWKRWRDTVNAVLSILDQSVQSYIVVCDNGSQDGSDNGLRKDFCRLFDERPRGVVEDGVIVFDYFDFGCYGSQPRITLVLSKINLGFAGGNNLAYRMRFPEMSCDYVWFLNNDTLVKVDTLSQLLQKMSSEPRIGICGATLIYEQQRDRVQALGGARYWPSTGRLCEIGQGSVWPQQIDEGEVEAQLDYASGASMFVRSELIEKVGLMAEDYFLYYEELDWAVRAKAAGFRLGYASDAVVYHKEGAVLGSGKSTKRSLLAEYYGLRNRLVFTWKHFPFYLPSVWLFSWLQVGKRLLQGEWVKARMMVQVLLGLRSTAP